ncbi:MAG: Gfo/Idh/MocA family protein [Velocimicrobium sp.]
MKKINWGVIGTANIAKEHTIPGMMQADNCNLYAIAGRNLEKVNEFKEKFGFQKAYCSYEELLDDEEIEAVYIPLANHVHKEWIIKAAKKKKHILCEKPMVPTPEETREVIKVCREEGVMLMEAFAYLHSDITKSVVDEVKHKTIGDIKLIEAVFFIPEIDKDNFRAKREFFGGSTYDVGCYNISLALRLLKEMPDRVDAMAHFTEGGIDDYSTVFMEFPNHIFVSTACGMCSTQRGDRYFIYGTEGRIEANIPYNADGLLSYQVIKDESIQEVQMEVLDNYRLEVEQFGRCIHGKETPFVENEFSLQVSKVIQMVLQKIGY